MNNQKINNFLFEYRANLIMFLNGSISDTTVSDNIVEMFTLDEAKIDQLENIIPDIGLLNRGMDISNPILDSNQKRHIALDLVEKTDKLINR